MRTSVLLARLIGPVFLAMGAGILVNRGAYAALAAEFLRSVALIYLSGLIALAAGLAIVNLHNVWAADWRVVITILGWLSLLGGIARIVWPQLAAQVGTAMIQGAGFLAAGVLVLALGAFLSFKGYQSAVGAGQ
jgi:hypothetical protein